MALKLLEAASFLTKEIVAGAEESALAPNANGSGREELNGEPSNGRAMMNSLSLLHPPNAAA
jgi:hypothetical protein